VAELARAEGIVTICDNSYCTPLFQRPIGMGIDITLQSATKWIGGHSDTIAGVICGSKDMMRKIFESEYLAVGSGIQPFNAWLLIRGLRTMPVRLEKSTRNTGQVAAFLLQHERVEKVLHPFLESFPQYELARRQMSGACGLLSFVMKATAREEIVLFCESLRHILMAVSWGGYESLIIPGCASVPPADFDASNEGHRTLRLYVGLEEPDYIIADLRQALMKTP
jgi:cystathionine beta-lyase/cystathionine gamma-synthase